jgi:DNA-binding PadR family transcriptional regulator
LGLIREQPDHGYALYERLKDAVELSLIWQTKRGKLYYLLEKLESKGYLSSSVISQGAYPERTVYRITSSGEEIFQDWLQGPVHSTRYVRLAFLSKLYFAQKTSPEQARSLIDKQIEICQRWRENLERQHKAISKENFLTSQVFLFRIGQIQAMLEWLLDCREAVPQKSAIEQPSHSKEKK